jgi:hypothetical protein
LGTDEEEGAPGKVSGISKAISKRSSSSKSSSGKEKEVFVLEGALERVRSIVSSGAVNEFDFANKEARGAPPGGLVLEPTAFADRLARGLLFISEVLADTAAEAEPAGTVLLN